MRIDLTPFPKREGGTIQSLSPFRREVWREVKIVPHWVENRYILENCAFNVLQPP
ncbi:hypothetical protein [Nostoc sp.]|uniref:hypothetical protein n=1 Tax=Nostoc sp. TaxID=1180 RepID=UPI002FF59F27